MTDQECIDIIKAKMEGKEIHWVPISWETWGTYYKVDDNHKWNFGGLNYRIKSEPLEFWVNVYQYGKETSIYGATHTTKKEAERLQEPHCIRTVLFREVLDESLETLKNTRLDDWVNKDGKTFTTSNKI